MAKAEEEAENRGNIIMDIDTDVLASRTNLVLQVNRSHLDRMEDFLRIHYNPNASPRNSGNVEATQQSPTVDVLAIKKSNASKSCSLIFLHAPDEKTFIEHMVKHHNFVLHGLNKIYAMASERSIIRGKFTPIKESDVISGEANDVTCISYYLLNLLQKLKNERCSSPQNEKTTSVVVKVEVFPPKLQHQVVSNLTTLLDAKSIPESELDIAPSNQTHTLSIVQILNEKDKGKNEKDDAFLVGIALPDPTMSLVHPVTTTDDICRAFHKLKEAFERYRHNNNSTINDSLLLPFSEAAIGSKRKNNCTKPVIAVDCGASPGGWTKYLCSIGCDEVYSIDPGELDQSISSLPNVHHLKMTAEKAIPELRDMLSHKEDCAVAIWVSDMCLHDIPRQVDMFLQAHQKGGIFQPNAAFVLTIKCNIGHGKDRFDMLAEEQASRLKEAGAYGIDIIHLFSNRIGERTIVGFIK